MMANEITITRGDTNNYKIIVKQDGNPMNISSYDATITIKKQQNKQNNKALLTKTLTKSDPANGELTLILTKDDTLIKPGTYYYDIRITDGNKEYTIINSTITIKGDITK